MAEQELKFKKLADVELVDEAPDTAHALAEIDGEIKRVAGGVGGGAGGYLVDATGELTNKDSTMIIATPVPGMMEALEKGSVVIVKLDMGEMSAGAASGTYAYMPCTMVCNYYDLAAIEGGGEMSEEQIALLKDTYYGYCLEFQTFFLNGHTMDELEEIMSTASLSTLSATPAALKLKGLKGGNAVAE